MQVPNKHQSMVFYPFTLEGALHLEKSVNLQWIISRDFHGFWVHKLVCITIEVLCLYQLFWLQWSTKNNSHTKNIFHEGHLYNGRYTQLTCLSEACQALRYDCQFAFHYLQTTYFYPLWKLICILTFKEKHFPWTFKN